MGITPELAAAHIRHWQSELKKSRLSYLHRWPSRLFRHDPVENIAEVLNSGFLLSRDHSDGKRPIDAAADEVIQASSAAYSFVRFYFRPKNPTQYHVEGIKKEAEIYQNAHIPMIGMFVFNSADILTRSDVSFSNGNMQTSGVKTGSDDAFFSTEIDFARVFHTGGIGYEPSHRFHRCAEVLVASPMDVSSSLQFVICRSNAEKTTLLNLLNPLALETFEQRIVTSDDMKVFNRSHTYVENVSLKPDGIVLDLSPRNDRADIAIELSLFDKSGARLYCFKEDTFQPRSIQNSPWKFKTQIAFGEYRLMVYLENCLAFDGRLNMHELPF